MSSSQAAAHSSPGHSRRGLSLRVRLSLLVAAITLPLVGVGIEASWAEYHTDRARAGTVLLDEARALAQAVDGEFERTRVALVMLSATPRLTESDLGTFDGILRDAARGLDGQPLMLFRPDGTILFNTLWPGANPPTALPSSAVARRAAESGKMAMSNLSRGPLSGRWLVEVAVPVFGPGQTGATTVRYVLAGGVWAERLSALLRGQGEVGEQGAVGAILDPAGTVVARTREEDRFRGQLPRPELLQRLRNEPSGLFDSALTLEGEAAVLAFARAPQSGYVVAVTTPQAVFEAPLRAALTRLLGLSAVLLLAGLAGAYALARGIVRAMRRIPKAAADGSATGLPEMDRLAGALATEGTERRRAQTALESANAELSDVLESIADGFYALDRDWRVVFANRHALELFGRPSDNLLGRPLTEALPELVGSHNHAQYCAVMADGRAREFRSFSPVLKRWSDFSIYPRRGGGISIYFRDVSAQVAAEQALRGSEARLRLAQRIGGVGSFDWTPGNGEMAVSEEFATIHGLPPECSHVQQSATAELVHPEDRAGFDNTLQALLHTAPGFELSFRIVRPSDGAVRWLNSRAEIFRTEAGQIARVVGVVQDVTDWREVQRRQDEALAVLNSLLDNAPVGLAFFDRTHRAVRLNGAVARLSGLPAEALLGRGPNELLGDPSDRLDAVVGLVFRTATPVYDIDLATTVAGRQRHWQAGFYPVPDPSGGVLWVGAVVTDVTERRRDQEQLRRLNENLEARVRSEVAAREDAQSRLGHAERMQALGQLAGGMAHDFNNVLQAVSGCAALIERRPDQRETVMRLARRIMDAAERGGSTTRRLLAFARRDELHTERIEPATLLAGVHEMIAPVLGSAIRLEVLCEPTLPLVLADRGQLETVLVNLAVNARDAMPDGGRLEIRAALDEVTAGRPHPAAVLPGRYLRLSVRDSGEGMDAATLARATEPFFTTKAKGKGTGLGLAMARGFVEQSGGGLAIESVVGEGTTVTLWLPASDAAAELAQPVAARASALRRILLIDDDELVRETVAAQLQDAGYAVSVAAGAEEALAELERRPQPPDLLLTDFSMPGMNGLALIRAARRQCPELPSILLTGYAGEVEGLLEDLPDRFALLRKPAEQGDLVARIEALLQGLSRGDG